MSWPALIVPVRHAESSGNLLTVEERAQLKISPHTYRLTERGRYQASRTGEYLRERFGHFDACFRSYYPRTTETFELLYPGEVAYEDARLAEAQRGIWNSYTQEEVDRYFPLEESRKKCEGYYHYRPPGGENWPDIELRILSFINCLRRDYAGKRVLVVTHGNWLVLFQRLVEHLSVDEALKRYEKGHFRNASVTVYEAPWRFPTGRSNLILREENIVPWEKD